MVSVRSTRGVRRVILFSKASVQAEWAATAPMREAMTMKRERLRALRMASITRESEKAAAYPER
jgi:hypothetical protein